ncbi:hypothetical protein MXM41_09245 [Leclercia adecarboxylata]|uniref:hypothetical protein n=1 Tax=Leclercia adecarboxylata TaxID=83655 RepID=UPI002DB62DB2|nr:hypothetical protein [Leclercia adecarboxylata]MEB6379119.1 hypothetical protein [Leclercia adecarboxylata]
MRELQTEEIAAVNGAGLIADAAAALGQGIGKIIDASMKNGTTNAAAAGESMGRGIGQIVEASVNILQSLFSSLFSKK